MARYGLRYGSTERSFAKPCESLLLVLVLHRTSQRARRPIAKVPKRAIPVFEFA